MASKIGTILSLMFVVIFFLFASDMMTMQYLYSDLDSTALTIGYQIAKRRIINNQFKEYVESNYNISFTYSGPESPEYGSIVEYQVSKTFKPVIISTSEMIINVNRSTVVGYYD